jgi:hypothetical protein
MKTPMTPYLPPVDKLLTYGGTKLKVIPNYVEELGFSAEHIPQLISMASDKHLHAADMDSLESWAPVHAWRVLGQLRATEAIEPLIALFHELDDDWSTTELPDIFGAIGPAAIEPLQAYLADSSHDSFDRATAMNSLSRIAQNFSDVRNECIAILTQQLERFADNEPVFNAFLIGDLIDLKAVESAPIMERAFAADNVDTFLIGDWDYVQVSLGLKDPIEVPKPKFTMEEMLARFAPKNQQKTSLGFAPSQSSKAQKSSKKKKKK